MILYLVIPCYNEEAVLPETAKRLKEKFAALTAAGKIDKKSRIVFVNDGSFDATWGIIKKLHDTDSVFEGICLSRNRGHQNALMAGLMTVKDKCDAAISLDADLQDDIDAIDKMAERFAEGYDIVYGVRSSREKDTFFKRTTARGFYRFMSAMGVETVYDHADYRLMSRRALDALAEFDEVNLFLRGLVPLVGFRSTTVSYVREKRFAGESKYSLKKMISFALEGITSMSVKPIRLITSVGVFVFAVSIAILIYSLVRHFMGNTVEGWTFLAVSIWALGGVQLLSVGIIGEYIGKIYIETKKRPKYIISEYLTDENLKGDADSETT